MKYIKILLITFSFLFTKTIISQQITGASSEEMKQVAVASKKLTLDTCILTIQYRMSSVNNLKVPSRKKENFMLLQIGKHISKFSDYFSLKADSLLDVYASKKISSIEATNKTLPILRGSATLNIFKNYPKGKITVTDVIPFNTYKYEENKNKQEWKIKNETLTVCGYECKKATTFFRGRNYTAWYAPKIPYSDGPWKFWGLPGLILKVTDDKDEYNFECVAVEKSRYTSEIYMLERDYVNTTKAKFNDALKKFHENPAVSVQTSGVTVKGGTIDNVKSRPFNPIELE